MRIASFLKKFGRDRRAATAMLMALMIVPMIVASGAAVDFSRLASARAQLQLAADSAALTGVGTYQNAGGQTVGNPPTQTTLANYNNVTTVANAAFTAFTKNLNGYATIGTPTVTVGCTSNAFYCGPAGYATTCNSTGYYCVTVTATATLKTSLLAIITSSVNISVTSTANTPIPDTAINGNNFTSTNVPNAYDRNGIYAYAVPLDANGNPELSVLQTATTSCTGPILNEAGLKAGPCPYFQIGDSANHSINLAAQNPIQLATTAAGQVIQPIAFLFVNYTGGTTNYGWVSQPDGGYCPDWTLYGQISQRSDTTVPPQDSLSIYSSAYMANGQPPTYGANHTIVPFTVPTGIGGNKAPETCPYYYFNYYHAVGSPGTTTTKGVTTYPYSQPITYADGTTANFSGTGTSNAYPQWNATYYGWSTTATFPANAISGGPPVINGCTPNGTTTPWNYSGANASSSGGNCHINGTYSTQGSTFNNCALIIQDFGPAFLYNQYLPSGYPAEPSTPALPKSFTNANDTLGTAPGRAIIEPAYNTAQTNTYWPPDSTAHRCYDPSAAFYNASTIPAPTAPICAPNTTCTFYTKPNPPPPATVTATDPSLKYDEIENPEAGAIYCNSSTPETYGLYWNDQGSNESDDLGYDNAINLFTCSIPSKNGAFTGPSTLSG